MKLEAAEAKYSAAPTISLGWPPRCRRMVEAARALKPSMSHALAISVRKGPGMMQFTRTFGAKACANPAVIAFRPAFAAAYGDHTRRRVLRGRARNIDDRAAIAGRHAGPHDRAQPERPLEIHVQHLVVERLGHVHHVVIDGRHTGVVDENVDLPELLVRAVGELAHLVPVAHVAGDRERLAPVVRTTSAAVSSQDSILRLAMTTSAPCRAKASTISRPRPRLPPVTKATLPVRSKSSLASMAAHHRTLRSAVPHPHGPGV